jgi:hypothetical protein
MANGIKQSNNGFNSIYKGNFSIGINNIAYGGTANTGFWNTIPATAATGNVTVAYLPKGSNGPSIYEISTNQQAFTTAINQIKTSLEGPYITTSTFTSTTNITIPASSTASTYPIEYNVSGINKNVNWVTVTLGILSGSNVQNLGIVLVAPDNTTYALLKGSLSSTQSTSGEINVTLETFIGPVVFNPYGNWDGYSQGNFNSNSYNGPTEMVFSSPYPLLGFSATTNYNGLNQLNGLLSGDTNGTWSLYIQDFGGDESTLLYANLSFTTGAFMFVDECFQWAASQESIALLNRDYPSISTSGLQLHIDPWYLPSANASAIYGTLSSGQKVSDLTNNNNDATTSIGVNLTGTNYESWLLIGNNPFTFDTVTNIPSGNSAYTTSVWFKTSSYTQGLVNFGTDTASAYMANFLYINNGGYVINDWCGTTITSTGSTLTNNIWHNAVVTYDGTVATIYIDGVFDTDLTVGTSLSVSPTSNLKIGGGGNQNDFNGNMGPVMIYNRALTANEVLTNYNNIQSSHGY